MAHVCYHPGEHEPGTLCLCCIGLQYLSSLYLLKTSQLSNIYNNQLFSMLLYLCFVCKFLCLSKQSSFLKPPSISRTYIYPAPSSSAGQEDGRRHRTVEGGGVKKRGERYGVTVRCVMERSKSSYFFAPSVKSC